MAITRRRVLAGLVSSLALPRVAAAQSTRVQRIGVLSPGNPTTAMALFEPGLRGLGWRPGANPVVLVRSARGQLDRLPALAAELVKSRVDVLIASSAAVPAARAATRTIPIVMAFGVDDPVEEGWVSSLAHPDTNITGVTLHAPELTTKRLELLRTAVPSLRRIGILAPHRSAGRGQVRAAEAAARAMDLSHTVVEVQGVAEYEPAFARMKRDGAEAVLMLSSADFFGEGRRLAELAVKQGLPMMSPFREVAESGALLGYGPSIRDLWRQRIPRFVDRLLRGAKPRDLPIEQPTTLELVVNQKTATMLGLTLPPSLVLRADLVVE